MFSRLFDWLKPTSASLDSDEAEAAEAWDEEKSAFLAKHLGPEHDMVMHAIIPYAVGGGLDLYYFPSGIAGTGIATMELVDAAGRGPSNKAFGGYELVMFTKQKLNIDNAQNEDTPFGAAHASINAILNLIARYSDEATLNPHETCEFPVDMDDVGGRCLIFDAFTQPDQLGPRGFGLLLIMEIYRSEMEYAMAKGGGTLLALLKEQGHYPYSDLDRPPVI